jgi:hypothetical protein
MFDVDVNATGLVRSLPPRVKCSHHVAILLTDQKLGMMRSVRVVLENSFLNINIRLIHPNAYMGENRRPTPSNSATMVRQVVRSCHTSLSFGAAYALLPVILYHELSA